MQQNLQFLSTQMRYTLGVFVKIEPKMCTDDDDTDDDDADDDDADDDDTDDTVKQMIPAAVKRQFCVSFEEGNLRYLG